MKRSPKIKIKLRIRPPIRSAATRTPRHFFTRQKKIQFLLKYKELESLTRAAYAIGASHATLIKALSEDPWFLKEKESLDYCIHDEVKNALYRRAKGYEYQESRKVVTVESGAEVKIETVTYNKVMPPDVEACKFILKNKMPEEFTDKTEMTLTQKTFEHFKNQQDRYAIEGTGNVVKLQADNRG